MDRWSDCSIFDVCFLRKGRMEVERFMGVWKWMVLQYDVIQSGVELALNVEGCEATFHIGTSPPRGWGVTHSGLRIPAGGQKKQFITYIISILTHSLWSITLFITKLHQSIYFYYCRYDETITTLNLIN